MTLLVGVDEAGYGPNLGPLAIGLTAWEVDSSDVSHEGSRRNLDLYRLLEPVVTDKPDGYRLAIADSKALYKPGGGLAQLELAVLSMLATLGDHIPTSFNQLVDTLRADVQARRCQLPWCKSKLDATLPIDCSAEEIPAVAERLRAVFGIAELRKLRARLVYPQEFNKTCERYGSKGLALSHWTLALLGASLDELPGSSVTVTCDKHGGRSNYTGLLSEHFPEWTLQVIVESRPRSAYRLTQSDVEMWIEFRTKGEARMETALSSMIAKYLRELAMGALNSFWQSHLPGLKSTAGYPLDARRFRLAIAEKQAQLGIGDELLWRHR